MNDKRIVTAPVREAGSVWRHDFGSRRTPEEHVREKYHAPSVADYLQVAQTVIQEWCYAHCPAILNIDSLHGNLPMGVGFPVVYSVETDQWPVVQWGNGTEGFVRVRALPHEWKAEFEAETSRKLSDEQARQALDAAFYGLGEWLKDGAGCCHRFSAPGGWDGKVYGSDQGSDDLPLRGALRPSVNVHTMPGPGLNPNLDENYVGRGFQMYVAQWKMVWEGAYGRVVDPSGPALPAEPLLTRDWYHS